MSYFAKGHQQLQRSRYRVLLNIAHAATCPKATAELMGLFERE